MANKWNNFFDFISYLLNKVATILYSVHKSKGIL